jgi:hypothetical protein
LTAEPLSVTYSFAGGVTAPGKEMMLMPNQALEVNAYRVIISVIAASV